MITFKDVDPKAKSKGEADSYDKTKTILTNFNKKKATCKTQNVYILLACLLITITLLIAVSIYYYLIKYQAKQLLLFHNRNNELKEILCFMLINVFLK